LGKAIHDNGANKYKSIPFKKSNRTKELWQREFIEDILDTRFNIEEIEINHTVGRGVDYTFENEDTELEIKNINHEGKELGKGFIRRHIADRYSGLYRNKLSMASCSDITEEGRRILDGEGCHYQILPYQTTPDMSIKQYVKNKRLVVEFLSNHGFEYTNPFERKKSNSSVSSNSIFISILKEYTNNTEIELDKTVEFSGVEALNKTSTEENKAELSSFGQFKEQLYGCFTVSLKNTKTFKFLYVVLVDFASKMYKSMEQMAKQPSKSPMELGNDEKC